VLASYLAFLQLSLQGNEHIQNGTETAAAKRKTLLPPPPPQLLSLQLSPMYHRKMVWLWLHQK
jgi:hypothetical protein